MKERIQKVQRYSFQRPFIEIYSFNKSYNQWRSDSLFPIETVKLSESQVKKYISRNVSYPEYKVKNPVCELIKGQIEYDKKPDVYWRDRSLTDIGPILQGYAEQELEIILSNEVQDISTISGIWSNSVYKAKEAITVSEKQLY